METPIWKSYIPYSLVLSTPRATDTDGSSLGFVPGVCQDRLFKKEPIVERLALPYSSRILSGGIYKRRLSLSIPQSQHMGGYQNHGPLLGPLNIRCRSTIGPTKGP